MAGVAPSLLLHPLDFMGCDDDSDLGFFPAMNIESGRKVELVGKVIDLMTRYWDVRPMVDHARDADISLTKTTEEKLEVVSV